MRVTITGALGFIGAAASKAFLESGFSVLGVDGLVRNLYPNERKYARLQDLQTYPDFTFLKHDLRSTLPTKAMEDTDVVVHSAAMAGLPKSWAQFKTYQDCNILATYNVLNHISQLEHRPHTIHLSTSSVYGSKIAGDEMSHCKPVSPYGVSKLAAESLIETFRAEFGLRCDVLRLFSVYGPDQRPDMAYALFCNQLLAGEPITIFGDGSQSRSNTHISDVCAAIQLASKRQLDGQVFNICGGETITLLSAVEVLSEALNVTPELNFRSRRPGDQLTTRGDATKAKALLDWSPSIPIQEGLRQQAQWFANASASGKAK